MHTKFSVSLNGSVFTCTQSEDSPQWCLDMDSVNIDGSMFMDGSELTTMRMVRAHIDGELGMVGAKINRGALMDFVDIDGSLFLEFSWPGPTLDCLARTSMVRST